MNSVVKSLPNEQLKCERMRRGWSREYVAEKIGVADPKTIGRWERGYSFPSAYFLQRLCDLFGMFAEDLGLYQEPRHEKTAATRSLNAVPSAFKIERTRSRSHSFVRTTVPNGMQKGQGSRSVQREVATTKHESVEKHDAQGFLTQWIKQQVETNKNLTVKMPARGNNDERIARVLDVVADQDFLMQIHNGVMVILMPLEQA